MTQDTRSTVAPIEGYYALLRNGDVVLPQPSLSGDDSWCSYEDDYLTWDDQGKSNHICGLQKDIVGIAHPAAVLTLFTERKSES
jgi:hypothetical protein